MRIKNESLDRKSEILDVLPKFFVMMEGTETEPRYFRALFSKIKGIEYLPFERDLSDLTWSNPALLMNQLRLELSTSKICLTYKEFLPFMIRYLKRDNPLIDVSLFKSRFNNELSKNGICNRDIVVNESIIEKIIDTLKTTSFINLVYDGLSNFKIEFSNLRSGEHPYIPETDKLILIADRDKNSFTRKQFDQVIKNGIENDIDVYITNPCFEFFLALHFNDLKSLSESLIKDNPKNGQMTYIHSQLLLLDSTYRKDEFDTEKYLSNVKTAIDNSLKYHTKLKDLKDNVGTNLKDLILKFISKN